jgi:thiol-disulfide isomerase/thioredoxin
MKSSALLALLVALFSLASLATAQTPSLDGLWDATVKIQNPKDGSVLVVPFRFELSGDPANIKGSFFNGDERVTSTGGRFSDGVLLLNFDHYASRLEAKLDNGVLAGKYGNPARALYDFSAQPHVTAAAGSGKAPNIDGQWEIEVESPKGEHAWRLIVKQSGTEVSAAILRVDGDTGTLTGAYADGKFLLSHFSGARPGILEIVPQPDGSLQLTQKSSNGPARTLTAWRPADARAKGLPAPADPSQHTRVKGPSQPFQFSFPDLNGKLVSNTDPQFKNKVVIVNVTGSWCPNCHDEAPFLAELYRQFHAQGLEIVALDFEETEQRKDPARLHAFIKKYGIDYTYLLAGEPSELQAKIPQAENLNAWPTTFFLGRDGKVRAIHAGFAAKASGEYNAELKRDVTGTVERLLSENVVASR